MSTKETHPMDTYHGNPPGNCPACNGTGYAAPQHGSCHHCSGTGWVSARDAIAIADWLTNTPRAATPARR